jgi:hypothetical protein
MSDATTTTYHHEAAQLLAPLAAVLYPFAELPRPSSGAGISVTDGDEITPGGRALLQEAQRYARSAAHGIHELHRIHEEDWFHPLVRGSGLWLAAIAGVSGDEEVPDPVVTLGDVAIEVRDSYHALLERDQVAPEA